MVANEIGTVYGAGKYGATNNSVIWSPIWIRAIYEYECFLMCRVRILLITDRVESAG